VIYLLTALFLGGFGNYLIPLMVGARDMVFPYVNMLSYWIYLLAVVLLPLVMGGVETIVGIGGIFVLEGMNLAVRLPVENAALTRAGVMGGLLLLIPIILQAAVRSFRATAAQLRASLDRIQDGLQAVEPLPESHPDGDLRPISEDHKQDQAVIALAHLDKILENQLANLQRIVPDEKEVDNFVRLLQTEAVTAGVQFRRVTAKPPVTPKSDAAGVPPLSEKESPKKANEPKQRLPAPPAICSSLPSWEASQASISSYRLEISSGLRLSPSMGSGSCSTGKSGSEKTGEVSWLVRGAVPTLRAPAGNH